MLTNQRIFHRPIAWTSALALLAGSISGMGLVSVIAPQAQAAPLATSFPPWLTPAMLLTQAPGTAAIPGLVGGNVTYNAYRDQKGNDLLVDPTTGASLPAANWQAEVSKRIAAAVAGTNTMVVSGFSTQMTDPTTGASSVEPPILFAGDSLKVYGGMGAGQDRAGTNPDMTPNGAWSLKAGLFAETSMPPFMEDFTYYPGSSACAPESDVAMVTGNGTRTVLGLWCHGVGTFQAAIHDVVPPAGGYEYHYVISPLYDEIYNRYGLIVINFGGPNNPPSGASATNSGSLAVVQPRLRLIKEVCAKGTGCDPNSVTGDDAPVPDGIDNTTGQWVDAATIPSGATQIQWRMTVVNTGDVALENPHIADDVSLTDPARTSDGAAVGTSDCAGKGFGVPALAVGASAHTTCTTRLNGPLTGGLVNDANANAFLPNTLVLHPATPFTTEVTVPLMDANGVPLSARLVGNAGEVGMVPSNADAAMVDMAGVSLEKWVCLAGTGCTVPADADFTSLGTPPAGWGKQTTVTNGTSAQWLIVAQNTGSVPLSNLALTREDLLAGGPGHGASTCTPTLAPSRTSLQPGEYAHWTCRTDGITAIAAFDSGNTVVNTAAARAEWTPEPGQPAMPTTVVSEEASAQVRSYAFAVGDRVWEDLFGDGLQGAGEPGVAGVTVHLLDSGGHVVGTTTTDTAGYYWFDDLPAGTYEVTFVAPPGNGFTHVRTGSDPTVDSDADQAGGRSGTFTLAVGAPHVVPAASAPAEYASHLVAEFVDPTVDAGLVTPTPDISIIKYDTLNGDDSVSGRHNAPDQKVLIAHVMTPIAFTITNTGDEPLTDVRLWDVPAAGSAALTGLRCDFPDGTSGTPGTDGVVPWAGPFAIGDAITCTATLPGLDVGAEHTDVAHVTGIGRTSRTPTPERTDDWNAVAPALALGDRVWQDLNGDGLQTPGEHGVIGLTVHLLDAADRVVDTTTTDAAGYYWFDNLVAGDYRVAFVPPTGSLLTRALVGTDRAVDSDADETTGRTGIVTLTPGGPGMVPVASAPADYASRLAATWINPTVDAGLITPEPDVSIVKFDTLNGDDIVTGRYNAPDEQVLLAGATTPIAFTIANAGDEALTDVRIWDVPAAGSAALTHLTCAFPDGTSAGPGAGGVVTWNGPFAIGDEITCTGTLPGLAVGAHHTDVAHVTGIGERSRTATPERTDDWNAVAPALALGDRVWEDLNGDGLQTPGEPGIPAVMVNLLDAAGEVVGTTVTDAAGYYWFDELAAGAYSVAFVAPPGNGFTQARTGTDRAIDSDADEITGRSGVVTLTPGGPGMVPAVDAPPDYASHLAATWIDPTVDAGLVSPEPNVSIVKYDTLNGDDLITGRFNAPDRKVLVAGVPTPVAFTIVNDGDEPLTDVRIWDVPAAGSSALTGLTCDFPDGTSAGPGAGGVVTWAGPFAIGDEIACTGAVPGLDIGAEHTDVAHVTGIGRTSRTPTPERTDDWNAVSPALAVGDRVWDDLNGDGLQTAGEPGVPDVTVHLLDADDRVVDTTITDAAGYYWFDNLAAGDYQVDFVLPAGHLWTTALAGTDRAVDSDADELTGRSAPVTLTPGGPSMVPAADAPADYASHLAATWIDPTVDAGMVPEPPPPDPRVSLTKWVCQAGTGCAVPAATDAETLAADGWVKATTVAYDGPATWLIVVTNAGDVPLIDVTLSDVLSGGGHGATTPECADEALVASRLDVDASALITCTTDAITNTALIGSGHAVVNTALVTGTAATDAGTPLPNPDGPGLWTVASHPDAAEVNTHEPPPVHPQITLSKWVCQAGTGCSVPADGTGLAAAGWVKATTVPYDSPATWLIVATNDGDVPLIDVTLSDAITGGGHGATTAQCADGAVIDTFLEAGASTMITCTTDAITNTSLIGSGTAVVNTASVTGTPADDTGAPRPNPDGSGDPWTVASAPDAAEVNALVPPPVPVHPQIALSKWVCASGTGCPVPPDGTAATLAADGWVKATTVAHDTAAAWLIVITNTGDVPLADVTLSDALTGGGHGATTPECADGTVITPLLGVGVPAVITCTTAAITNTSLIGAGNAVVNTASATGTPADATGVPLPNPDGSGDPWTVASPPDAAEVNALVPPPVPVHPQIALSKWVCATGTGCPVPPDATPATLAVDGWVKATTVAYDTAAAWLIVITNTGDVPLADVTLSDALTGGGHGATTPECADGTVITPLLGVGVPAVITCTTAAITNTSLIGAGDAVVNTASATGTPADATGVPLPNPDGSGDPWTVASPPDAAEVNTLVPPPVPTPGVPQVSLSKWVCEKGTGCPVPTAPTIAAAIAAGWAKATTVAYDTAATWLIVITNDGETALTGVTLADALAGADHGATSAECADGTVITGVLAAGASTMITCTTAAITNTALLGSGDAVVNTASVTATPSDDAGVPLPNPDDSGTPWTVASPPDAAEANTVAPPAPPPPDPQLTLSKWVCTTGTGCAVPTAPTIAAAIAAGWAKATTVAYDTAATWLIVITNTGDVPLANVTLADALAGADHGATSAECADGTAIAGVLAAGASTMITCATAAITNTALLGSGDAVVNTASVTATPSDDAGVPLPNPDDSGTPWTVASPPDAAEANTVAPPAPPPPNPQLTLSKWVCLTGTGCAVPTTPTTAALAADGWVKATTVAYDTAATWLIVITNTGDVPLANVRLSDAVTGDGHGATTAACADGTVITPLLGTGASSVITCTTPEITNTSLIGSGHAVVNTAYATGTPAGDDGTPLPNPDGSAAWTVTSGPDAAEANTRTPPAPPTVNPQLDLSKWVCRTGTGCAVPAVATTSALASAGWVKATTVTYDSDATWLIVVTNDGDTALAHVTLADTITGDGRGETSPECADGTLIAPLLPAGASTVITCTTAQITDTSLIGSGTAVVNTASATGTPAAPDGTPLPNPDGSASWTVVSHPDAAEVNTVAPPPAPVPVHPQVTLSKWVCQGGIGCPVPPEFSAGPATLAADGWVKATTVDYDGIAAWLVAITNTGDVPLLNLTLTDTLTGGGHGIMTAGCDNGMIITPRLNVGASAVITCTTAEITNTAALDSGDAVVNTASVEGTPADADGAPLPNPDGSSTAWTVTSPPDAARVNAAEPAPHMEDVKYDTANGDTITTGDYDGTAKRLAPDVATPISVVVTNDGTESLINLVVKDQTIAGVGVLTGLTCDFSGLGGPATGTTWAGPFRPGESFTCTGTLPALARGQKHSDKVIVIATGDVTGKPVTCEDEWNGNVPVRPDAPTGGTAADDAARASAAGASMLALTLLVLGAWVARRRWSAE